MAPGGMSDAWNSEPLPWRPHAPTAKRRCRERGATTAERRPKPHARRAAPGPPAEERGRDERAEGGGPWEGSRGDEEPGTRDCFPERSNDHPPNGPR